MPKTDAYEPVPIGGADTPAAVSGYVEEDGVVEEAGAWLLCAPVVERIERIVEKGCLN